MRRLLLVLFCALLLSSFGGCNRVQDNIKKLQGQTIHIPFDSMYCWTSDSVLDSRWGDCASGRYKYVVYMDSSLCSSCNIERLYLWNELLSKMPSTVFYFIIAPHHAEDIDYLPLYLRKSELNSPVFIDVKYQFLECNPYLPK